MTTNTVPQLTPRVNTPTRPGQGLAEGRGIVAAAFAAFSAVLMVLKCGLAFCVILILVVSLLILCVSPFNSPKFAFAECPHLFDTS